MQAWLGEKEKPIIVIEGSTVTWTILRLSGDKVADRTIIKSFLSSSKLPNFYWVALIMDIMGACRAAELHFM